MQRLSDKKIIESWRKNAEAWIEAIRDNEIESRIQVTDKAIVDAVLERKPKTVLDVGCGEGWLVRELTKSGIDALGIDIVPELIESALTQGSGSFKTVAYEDLSNQLIETKFDAMVCNFSLLGNESVNRLFQQAASLLNRGGAFIVQTIHPIAGCGEEKYADGWREGSWEGFSNKFSDPAPWYFRTMESWKSLFTENGFMLNKIHEPLHPTTKIPASVIFIGIV